jgi:hypothetical protein
MHEDPLGRDRWPRLAKINALLRKESIGVSLVPDPDRELGTAGFNPDYINGDTSYQNALAIDG